MERRIESVRLEMIDPPEVASRDLIDPDKIRELAESIRAEGLKQPIKLRPVNGRFEIVFGHRRYLAHKFLGKDCIDAEIKEMSAVEMHKERAIENLQREDLSPIETAKEFYRLHFELSLSIREVCAATGKALSTVQKYLKLMELDDEFKRAVDKGWVGIAVAFKLWEIDDPQSRGYFLRMAVDNGITLAVAEGWVSDWKQSKAGTLFDNAEGGRCTVDIPESRPVYMTCGACLSPVELREARQVIVCPNCLLELKKKKSLV